MNPYTEQIIYRIKCESIETEQYDEQWRLVFAENDRDALYKARVIAKKEEATFVDRHGRTITWELVAVKDLQEVDLEHGTLLFSYVKEVEPIAAPLWEI
jgi:hypothetical protein